jgi:hypothetical protein
MTETEKLRALLADTAMWLSLHRDPDDGLPLYAAQPLLARIDAALAEPIASPEPMIRLSTAQTHANDAAREGFSCGFQRGAEDMREAAALAVHDMHTTGLLTPAAVTAAVRVIRRLPVPEEKP